jgi:hypothetical protein
MPLPPLHRAVLLGDIAAVLRRFSPTRANRRQGQFGYTAFMRAIPNVPMMRLLRELGARVDIPLNAAYFRSNAVHCAVTRPGATECLLYLITELGMSINSVDTNGNPPLWHAIVSMQEENVAFLLARGADVFLGNDLLTAAAECGNSNIFKMLLCHGAPYKNSAVMRTPGISHEMTEMFLDHVVACLAAERGETEALKTCPLPVEQWERYLAPEARAELKTWGQGITGAARQFHLLMHEALPEGPVRDLGECDDLRRELMGFMVHQDPEIRKRALAFSNF